MVWLFWGVLFVSGCICIIYIYIYTCVIIKNIYIYTQYICAIMFGRCVVTCQCRCADIVISRFQSLKHLNI